MTKFAIYVVLLVASFGLGWWAHSGDIEMSRSKMRSHLAACGYTPHAISDVAWEMVRIGMVPAMTGAYFSARVNSANNHNALKSCMTTHYGG